MAIARFKRNTESGKSSLILVKANKFVMSWTPVYVPADACAGMAEDQEFNIPDGYTLVPLVSEDGEPRTAKDGSILHSLVWN